MFHEENTLKIEIVENSHPSYGEDGQGSKYLMIAELPIGKETHQSEDISIKVVRWRERQDQTKKEEKPKPRKEIEVKDSPESYEYYTEDKEFVPPKEGTSDSVQEKSISQKKGGDQTNQAKTVKGTLVASTCISLTFRRV